ncbi:putative glucosyltransferase [Talaromyces proteolyticus]|uniref:Dol-P-Glc:Glc(2)Man(9)GlcNAc(2)-PP-Dol alpha-1,2-glucosyltransferase n=1 Tax=Talaromyces proteolyticus TaxID=1131652 RepID=A0AAD4PSH4_9EURO|nr:putative glucosyltransferase [Talaromyces proteolyticus]KAH8691341.1 putative glucosyltransferase [Talaromyces proteolyticus]
MNSPQPKTGLTLAGRYLVPFVLLSLLVWRNQVNHFVQEPYLDEVFHVGQAQAYWANNWSHWDPKITTPPGLYVWSYVLCAGILLLRGSPKDVGVNELRATNLAATALFLPWRLQTLLDLLRKEPNTRPSGAWINHTVLNICLFPPLFFFSGLYYTDVLALLVVVEAYIWDIKRSDVNGPNKTTVGALRAQISFQNLVFLVLGLVALIFRQTNIFWVSVFMGGLQVVRTIRQNTKPCAATKIPFELLSKGFQGELYDPLVEEASFIDYLKTGISLACATVSQLPLILASITSHLLVLAAFGGFILWNGSVVLGHKEFHSAGIHIPQMLYIWPYFIFFSWPLIIIGITNITVPRRYLPKFFDYRFSNTNRLPGILTALGVIPLMLLAIHFNTIVHPFTLADNRHYVFYVFRLLTRYHPAVKYAVAPVYFLCAWAVFTAIGFYSPPGPKGLSIAPTLLDSANTQTKQGFPSQQKKPETKKQQKKQSSKKKTSSNSNKTTTTGPQNTQVVTPEIMARIQAHVLQRQQQRDQQQIRVSFVLIWLVATGLSLITAPLVEPRYFIIPWVMWRLHLPRQPTPEVVRQQQKEGNHNALDLFKAQIATELPHIMETVWFLLVNAITGYVFLYKGFEWPQEPGKIQRFMW